ncbi:MAG TPA: hypothetical protein VM513_33835 [Kofleriaceae bacterium]|jgi:hypothetical protein|nr:hypothetical protein [Kofleriaceae bacterium]
MQRLHRTTFLLAITACLWLAACKNKQEIRSAKSSLYDTDFAVVYSAALAATREQYTNVDDFPGNGIIKTAWHQVSYANKDDDLANQRTVAQSQGMGTGTTTAGQAAAGMPTRLAYKRSFIRFDVTVAGGRPWRVKVVGHAAEWEPGNALPTELRGAARPPWLDGRTESLQVAIYRKIKAYAVPMKEEVVVDTRPKLPKTDPSTFKDVPAPAATQLATIKDALARRDYAALRASLADDVVWSLGGAPGAETAMAMWQADAESLDAMARVIAGGCAAQGNGVACPAGPPAAGAWQLQLEPRGDAWRVTSFLRAE